MTAMLLFSIAQQANADSIDDVNWITHNYPPYNYTDDKGMATGSAVDIIKNLLVKAGSKKTIADIQVLTWARAYEELQKNKNYALISTSRTEERENLFKWVGPLAPSNVVLFAKKTSNIKIDSVNDIAKYTVGAVNNAAPQKILIAANPDAKIEVTPNLEQGVAKLGAGRIELVVADDKVLNYLVTKLKLDNDAFEVVYILKKVDYWVGFNKETSDEVVNAAQKALDSLK